jgi:hypothetical protein
MVVELNAGKHGGDVSLHDDSRAAQASPTFLNRVLLLLNLIALVQLLAGVVDLRAPQTIVLVARVLIQQVELEREAVLRDASHDPFAARDAGRAGRGVALPRLAAGLAVALFGVRRAPLRLAGPPDGRSAEGERRIFRLLSFGWARRNGGREDGCMDVGVAGQRVHIRHWQVVCTVDSDFHGEGWLS